MQLLEGKVVVVTGAGRGIGAACAQGIARQGAKVVINDIDLPQAEETAAAIAAEGGTAIACAADVADWDESGRLIATCLARFGRIDGLVNNAARYHVSRLENYEPEAAELLVRANVLGPLHCTGHAVKPMLAQKSGSIVNVTSGAHMGIPGLGVYGATKGAVASMLYGWALELGGTGVRVNGLSPFGRTRMGTADGYVGKVPPPHKEVDIQPPEANAPVVEYLLSDRAAHVNGQIVRIDRRELQLYTHPALLLPAETADGWTAERVADAFDGPFRDRLVPCGVLGMREGPIGLDSGFWARADTLKGRAAQPETA